MAVGPSNKGSGKLKRTTIDPRIGGTKGDAGFAGKAGSKGPGTLGGSRGRTTIDPRIGGQKGDAGFSGKAKQLSGFGKAFSIALAKGPGTLFTYQGKKYKAIKKHEGKGPSASRVQDKVTKATMVKGKRDTTNKSLNDAVAGQKTIKKVLSKKKTPTPASGKFGQRRAGGMMGDTKSPPKLGAAAYKEAKKRMGEDRVTLKDLQEASKVLGYKLSKERMGKDRMTVTDVQKAKKLVGKRKAGGLSEGIKKVKAMKAKKGGFPDLSGDGKITQKDILMGRGVIKKRGGGAAIKGMNFKGVL